MSYSQILFNANRNITLILWLFTQLIPDLGSPVARTLTGGVPICFKGFIFIFMLKVKIDSERVWNLIFGESPEEPCFGSMHKC